MFKIIGSIVVLLSATLWGMQRYSELYERKRILCIIRDGSEKIRRNLCCMCMELYECFLQGGEFFEKAAGEMHAGALPGKAVNNAADSFRALNSEDRNIIMRFAAGLSADDCKGQIANIELFLKELEHNIDNASSELAQKGSLSVKGSILSALAVVLLLL